MTQIEKRDIVGPISIDELKRHLHLFTDDFDESLDLNINAACAKAESFANMKIWKTVESVSVPFEKTIAIAGPAQITDVEVDGEGASFTYENGVLSIAGEGASLSYKVIRGYDNKDCPADIKMAILLIAAKYFTNPVDSVEQLPTASQALLQPYKNYCV